MAELPTDSDQWEGSDKEPQSEAKPGGFCAGSCIIKFAAISCGLHDPFLPHPCWFSICSDPLSRQSAGLTLCLWAVLLPVPRGRPAGVYRGCPQCVWGSRSCLISHMCMEQWPQSISPPSRGRRNELETNLLEKREEVGLSGSRLSGMVDRTRR